ncbi:MAG: hypothetical protein IPK91_15385 [Saprospiraceae bacterium]|nr:hypothetical protein [Saprospiraceae bacterium]
MPDSFSTTTGSFIPLSQAEDIVSDWVALQEGTIFVLGQVQRQYNYQLNLVFILNTIYMTCIL